METSGERKGRKRKERSGLSVKKQDIKISRNLKDALTQAAEEEFSWLPSPEELRYEYAFSLNFEKKMKSASCLADRVYISVGRHRVRRMLAIALIVALIMAMTAGAVAIQRLIVNWNEVQNDEAGTLDVTFEVDDPNGMAEEFRFKKPETPVGYEIVREEKYSETDYEIEYHDKNENIILYWQSGDVETMGVGFDNEDAEFYEVTVNGYKGYSYSKLGKNALHWVDGVSLFGIIGTCDMDTVWRMAESIE